VTEILTVAGLDAERLDWVSSLYGRVDPKYREREFVEHLFLHNPIGPSLHAFAVDDGRAVGHCCVVRTAACVGETAVAAGKLEALFLEESHRGRTGDAEPVVQRLLTQLYAFSDAQGIELVHALATPRIGRVIGFDALDGVGARTFVSVVRADGAAAGALALGQAALRRAAAPRRGRQVVRRAEAADRELVEVPTPGPRRWAIVAGDAWDWYRGSPLIRVLELRDSRALVQLPAAGHEPLRLVGWRAERPSLPAALRLVAAVGRVAREHGAATLRFQPWLGPSGNGALARACRLVGFVRREDLTTVWLHTTRRELAQPGAPVSTPFLYLGF
jgi:hypothetical protein